MALLDPLEGYRRWAPGYSAETAISYLDDRLVGATSPPSAGRRLLDAGCGTGRRLLAADAALAVGVDPSAEMLAAGIGSAPCDPRYRALLGDVRALPLPDRSFDLVWCRLVLGHLPELATAYAELARVLAPGGRLIVTDFHPAAHAAGHRRTFRDDEGVHEIEHHAHAPADHLAMAGAQGLTLLDQREAAIGPDVRDFYARAGRLPQYEAHRGLPVVIALAFGREA